MMISSVRHVASTHGISNDRKEAADAFNQLKYMALDNPKVRDLVKVIQRVGRDGVFDLRLGWENRSIIRAFERALPTVEQPCQLQHLTYTALLPLVVKPGITHHIKYRTKGSGQAVRDKYLPINARSWGFSEALEKLTNKQVTANTYRP